MGVLDKLEVTSTAQKFLVGVPHAVVLGWAFLLSFTVYKLVTRMDSHEIAYHEHEARHSESTEKLANAISSLTKAVQSQKEEQIRVRTTLEMKWPETSRRVAEALEEQGDTE